jgi:hypothetical protein
MSRDIREIRDSTLEEITRSQKQAQSSLDAIRAVVDSIQHETASTSDRLRRSLADPHDDRFVSFQKQLDDLRGGSDVTVAQLGVNCTEIQRSIESALERAESQITRWNEKVDAEFARMCDNIKAVTGGSTTTIAEATAAIDSLRSSVHDISARVANDHREIAAELAEARNHATAYQKEIEVSIFTLAEQMKNESASIKADASRISAKAAEALKEVDNRLSASITQPSKTTN